MREKLQTLPVAVLKEMAKEQGIKGATALRKAELIEALCNAAGENAGHITRPKTATSRKLSNICGFCGNRQRMTGNPGKINLFFFQKFYYNKIMRGSCGLQLPHSSEID